MKISDSLTLELISGFTLRQLEVISDNLSKTIEQLRGLEQTHCKQCGTELTKDEFMSKRKDSDRIDYKRCPNCRQCYAFQKGNQVDGAGTKTSMYEDEHIG